MSTIQPDVVWNTWDWRFPASITHQPSGLTLRYAAYSSTHRKYTNFHVESIGDVSYGLHRTDGSYTNVQLTFAGATVRMEIAKPNWHTVVGQVTILDAAVCPSASNLSSSLEFQAMITRVAPFVDLR